MAVSPSEKIAHARSLCEQARWPEVLEFAQAWAAETPADAKAWYYSGIALAAAGRLIDAETSYRRGLKLDASDFKAWNNLAALLFGAMNRPVDAAQCLMQALQIDPGNQLGWANLASMNGQLGRHAQALECAERALALNPQMVEALLHRARAAQALEEQIMTKTGPEDERLEAIYQRLEELDPSTFEARPLPQTCWVSRSCAAAARARRGR